MILMAMEFLNTNFSILTPLFGIMINLTVYMVIYELLMEQLLLELTNIYLHNILLSGTESSSLIMNGGQSNDQLISVQGDRLESYYQIFQVNGEKFG